MRKYPIYWPWLKNCPFWKNDGIVWEKKMILGAFDLQVEDYVLVLQIEIIKLMIFGLKYRKKLIICINQTIALMKL